MAHTNEPADIRRLILDELQYELVYENLPVGVVVWDKDAKFVCMNRRNAEIFGLLDTSKIEGFCLFDDKNIEPEDLNKMRTSDSHSYHYTLIPWNLLTHGKCNLESERSLFCRFRKIYDKAKNHIGYILVNVDMTEVQNSLRNEANALSRQLQQIHYSANMMTWNWNLKIGKILVNRSFAPIEYADQLSGVVETSVTDFINRIHPEDRSMFLEEYENLTQRRTDTAEIEVRYSFKNTQMGYLWVHINAIISDVDVDGSPVSMVGSIVIIEERKKMEEELRLTKEKAVKSDMMKMAFIEQTNHEIRTPLNAIVGYADILSSCHQSMSDEEIQEVVKMLHTNSDMMIGLVNNMLYSSQLLNGLLKPSINSFSVFDLCNRNLHKFMKMTNMNVTLTLDNSAESDLVISSDSHLVCLILENLLSNATKFTMSGSINMGFIGKEDGVEFYVADTGPGLPENVQEMFSPFSKGDRFTQGMGLGLPLCRDLVNLLDGKLTIDSKPNKGCKVMVYIPNKAQD